MSRIDDIFLKLRRDGRKALMPFVCGGYPRPGLLARILPELERAGASVVEIGIPFSDPIADGPVIAAAMHEAIEAGTTPQSIFDEVRSVRDRVGIGIVAMVSVSIVHRLGGPRMFVAGAAQAGFDGFIFPDAPLEESDDLLAEAGRAGCTASLLIAPTTPPERAANIARASTGFVYLLARSGITGERTEAPSVGPAVETIRRETDLPIACGFGISTAEHVAAVTAVADAAIVGSALVRRMADADDPVAAAGAFVTQLAAGLDGATDR